MRILGIDPGTATTGYGVINVLGENKYDALKWGLIETSKEREPGNRLVTIQQNLQELVKKYDPHVVAIEKVFFARNVKTAIRVGQAQGVMLYTAALSGLVCVEYSPMTIKKIVTGNGRADKKTVQTHVRKYLGNKVRSEKNKKTHFDNAADALAVALCHAHHLK